MVMQAATEAARQAEQRAASSSSHSAAYQEVGASQAGVSEQVCGPSDVNGFTLRNCHGYPGASGHMHPYKPCLTSVAAVQAASAQAAQSTAVPKTRVQAMRANVHATSQRAWSAGSTRLSRLGHALQLDRFNFGRAWQAVFQFLSDVWERCAAGVLSAWHWAQGTAHSLGSKLRTNAQNKAQAS